MNTDLFLELMGNTDVDNKGGENRLNQHVPEWKIYLEIVDGIFGTRGVVNPIVVEIGILDGAQRAFYEELFGATYISIDINPKSSATIRGSSSSVHTISRLKEILDGRMIDLLFIDGLHTYGGVRSDYDMYHPLVKHITAIHDILTPKNTPKDTVDVIRFWNELKESNKKDTLITIQHHNPRKITAFNGRPLGIGMCVKGQEL